MNYHVIRTDDMLNGDGLRVVLFVSGCSHHCLGCHNPETWNPTSGQPFDNKALDRIMEELGQDYISGLTLSGGDPLHESNLIDVLNVVSTVKEKFPDKTIWLYTGMSWEDIFEQNADLDSDFNQRRRRFIVSKCDVLVDGKFVRELADVNYPWCGSTNQRVIDVKESLIYNTVIIHKS